MATSFVSVGERYDATRARMLRMLEDLEQSGRVLATAYARPGRDVSPAQTATAFPGMADELAGVVIALGRPDTGVAAFWETDIVTAVVPPFPIAEDAASAGLDAGPLRRLLGRQLRVAVVMIRLGRYAVGVLDGETLVASKTDTRYVKSRHRAGGSSQRRFERSRERLVRELYDRVCEVAADILRPFGGTVDHLLLGGEKHTVGGLLRRCEALRRLKPITLERRLDVRKPGQKALDGIHDDVWSSRVVVFNRAAGE